MFFGLSFLGLNAQKNSPPPNIVMIVADDLGFECINSYGGTSYDTPNLTQLAQTGMQFENCHSQPICTPSRVKLMTGKSNKKNHLKFGYLNPKEVTFSQLLRKKGYVQSIKVIGKHYKYYKAMPLNFNTMDRNLVNKLSI